MGAMNRPIPEDEQLVGDWLLRMFLQELAWGVFVLDADGAEGLVAAVVDQPTGVAVAVALGSAPRHIRIRRLR